MSFATILVIPSFMPPVAAAVWAIYATLLALLATSWGNFQLVRAWLAFRRRLPFRLIGFLDDARQYGILQVSSIAYQFGNPAVHGYFNDPARLPKNSRQIDELTNWALENPEIRNALDTVGAERGDVRQAVNITATESVRAGQPFTSDAATRQTILERLRLRLNELGRRSLFGKSLRAQQAPGLGTVLDASQMIQTQAMDDLGHLADRLSSASIGISGARGIGKSTLIRWLCHERNTRGRPRLGLYVTAPVQYDAREFLVQLYISLCQTVIKDDRFMVRRLANRRTLMWRFSAAVALAVAAVVVGFHQDAAAIWFRIRPQLWWAMASLLATAALGTFRSAWHHRSNRLPRSIDIEAVARKQRRRLRHQVTETFGQTGAVKGPLGLSLSGSRSHAVTENQMTLPELVHSYREFAEMVVSALRDRAQDNSLDVAQVRLIVGIDEIDRIENGEEAEKFLNEIKAIFGIPYCIYVASLSAEALANFERRAVSARTVFDTTFDAMLRIPPLQLEAARQLLERRAIGLPYFFIALCHVLSGGVPRELTRVARSIFAVRSSPDLMQEPEVSSDVIVAQVIARELDSLRQGSLPLAAHLAVPGAAELIGLLDDPEWPAGSFQEDLARMSDLFARPAIFTDESGSIAAATKICDGLAAAIYFFLTAEEAFITRADQIIADLMGHELGMDQETNSPAAAIQLLSRARSILPVNPALAISRTREFRRKYKLTDVSPVLLSQAVAKDE